MRERAKPLALALAVVALLPAAVSGCGGNGAPASDGPLSSAASIHGPVARGSECSLATGRPQTFGLQVFTNYGNTTVILDRVVLLSTHNERLIGSYAVPGDSVIGSPHGWPPSYPGMPAAWKHRQPVHSYRVRPGKTFNLVIGVVAITSHRATSRGMLVYYHDPAGSYVARDYWATIIAAKSHSC